MKKGKHSVFLALPEKYHAPIGLVVAFWGHFETAFDACLDGLIQGEMADGGSRDTKEWKKRKFRTRRALFKTLCSEWLSSWKPDAASKLIDIADRSADLHWRRNMIAHGTYAYAISPHSHIAENCRAINAETGQEMPFDEMVLKKLYHDISHLTADLVLTFRSFGEVTGPFSALPDTEILRVYRETNHPWHPNPKKRTPPPQSSPA